MYARSTSITGNTDMIDACIGFLRDEVMPALTDMDGWRGLSLLVNRDSGRCIATTSWQSEEAMLATDRAVSPFRARASELMGGGATVQEWEIAVRHREHDAREGSWCRVTWLAGEPSEIDTTVDFFKDTVMTRLEATDEFCSASMLVNRETGECCGTARFDTRAALEATRELAGAMREQRSRSAGVEFTDVDEFELVIAHLRVPELV